MVKNTCSKYASHVFDRANLYYAVLFIIVYFYGSKLFQVEPVSKVTISYGFQRSKVCIIWPWGITCSWLENFSSNWKLVPNSSFDGQSFITCLKNWQSIASKNWPPLYFTKIHSRPIHLLSVLNFNGAVFATDVVKAIKCCYCDLMMASRNYLAKTWKMHQENFTSTTGPACQLCSFSHDSAKIFCNCKEISFTVGIPNEVTMRHTEKGPFYKVQITTH